MPRTHRYRPLTAVRLRSATGGVYDFDSLDAFVRNLPRGAGGRRIIETFGLRFQRYSYLGPIPIAQSDGVNDGEDRQRVLDDLWGDPIPRDRIYAAWQAAQAAQPPTLRRIGRVPVRDVNYRHRLDPVPGTACLRGGGHLFRHPRTRAEKKAWEDLGSADHTGAHLPVKARRKRSARNLPDSYDDLPIAGTERCWKRHRRTQYRPVDKRALGA